MRTPLPARLTPLATELGVTPLYGDIHNHCALSYGHGSLETALDRASLQLDFVSITGHAAWPDMPVDDPSVAHIVDFHVKGFAKLKQGWEAHFVTLASREKPGVFSVFPGYEIHSCTHGDYTIVYADLEPDEIALADSPSTLKQELGARQDRRALAFPHHIGYRTGARGINWSTFDRELSPFVEMFSMHGCAETSESGQSYLHSMGPVDAGSTMQSGLKSGKRFGIVGNTDHHSGFPGSYGHGRTCVYSRGRDRNDIWDGLMAARTNALTGDTTHLLTCIGDQIQGGTIPPQDNARLQIEAVAGGFIDHIDIFKNGALIERISPDLTPSPVSAGTGSGIETVLFLELGWGARRTSHDWTGGIEIANGEVFGVEPRFRGAEIVSPLEGQEGNHSLPKLELDGGRISFSVTAEANPNNVTSATQGLLIRFMSRPDTMIRADLCGAKLGIPAARLFEGALSGNLGPIDSPAYRFHTLPLPHQWQWAGFAKLGDLGDGDNVYTRLTQRDGQRAWTSPIFCGGAA